MVFIRDLLKNNSLALFQNFMMEESAPRVKPIFGCKKKPAIEKPKELIAKKLVVQEPVVQELSVKNVKKQT